MPTKPQSILHLIKALNLFFLLILVPKPHAAQSIRVNQVGYEKMGTKTAILENSATFTAPSTFIVKNSTGTTTYTGTPSSVSTVEGWSGRYFSVLDFSACTTSGSFTVSCGGTESDPFTIDNNCIYSKTALSAISFFTSMRNTDAGDHSIGVFNTPGKKVDVYGGWNDATGDRGKYLSHLSFANYFNPQQIPLVVWSLCKSLELGSSESGSPVSNASAEAGWGADYLVRALDQAGYFYITVFDGWGWQTPREVCAWRDTNGVKTADYQTAFREGGGMSIAALAYASRMKVTGELSSSYLSSAEKAYTHIKANNLKYVDDGKENIIDDYCALMAAIELYKATSKETYLTDAQARATSLMNRQSSEGWFYSDNDKLRPFYHGADEGLPLIALMELASIDESLRNGIYEVVKKATNWYQSVTGSVNNPFNYIRQISPVSGGNGVNNISSGKPATASSAEKLPQQHPVQDAFDNNLSTRWASDTGSNTEWIQVDLGDSYAIESVSIQWEAAYGKVYKINVSDNNSTWTTAATVTNNEGAVKKVTSLDNVKARYVRMQGVERGTRYGYSIFEFTVYGKMESTGNKFKNSFFMPHNNETGYWWQGENARIASLTAAFSMAQRLPIFTYEESLDLTRLAQQQIDWILGKNPYGTCMMYGFGKTNYAQYEGKAGYVLTNFKGGICNGITSAVSNEADITFMPYTTTELWNNWRWIEQWLPHNAWFLTATSLQSYNFNNPRSPIIYHAKTKYNGQPKFWISGSTLRIQNVKPGKIMTTNNIYMQDLQGRTLSINADINNNTIIIPLSSLKPGTYITKLSGTNQTFRFIWTQ